MYVSSVGPVYDKSAGSVRHKGQSTRHVWRGQYGRLPVLFLLQALGLGFGKILSPATNLKHRKDKGLPALITGLELDIVSGACFCKTLKPSNLKFINHYGNHCLCHA